MSGVALVQFSNVDLAKLLPLGRQVLDRNLADAADSAGHDPPLHHMLCIASMKQEGAKSAESTRPYLNLFHAGFLVAADERDFAEILELAGLPCVMVETAERGVLLAFIAGTLSQWRDAVVRGCRPEVSREARHIYNKVFTEFKNLGLAGAFDVTSKPSQRDHTFLLEYSPK